MSDLKERVIQWLRENHQIKGKWSAIGKIAKDLGLETFPFEFRGTGKFYTWNRELAIVLNELLSENILEVSRSGNAYLYTYKETSS